MVDVCGLQVIFWHGRMLHAAGLHHGDTVRFAVPADFQQAGRATVTPAEGDGRYTCRGRGGAWLGVLQGHFRFCKRPPPAGGYVGYVGSLNPIAFVAFPLCHYPAQLNVHGVSVGQQSSVHSPRLK